MKLYLQYLKKCKEVAGRSPVKSDDIKGLDKAIFQVVLRLKAICQLQLEAPKLKLWEFVNDKEIQAVDSILANDFSTRHKDLMDKVQGAITEEVKESAKKEAVQAAIKVIKPEAEKKSESHFKDVL